MPACGSQEGMDACWYCGRPFAAHAQADPLQLPEPEPCATVAYPDGIDLLEGASRATWLWLVATAAVTAGLAAVLLVLGLRRIRS